jgi:hypothetical protein
MTEPAPTALPVIHERRLPRWSARQTHDITASAMALGALVVVSILALRGSEAALGALLSILSAATGFLMRGRVEPAGN